ncbi:GC-rich sequence DNA-binding factor-like protein-domain-containing protein [Pseudomassariella vexata]|uniref:GC-rich sequence DNA-binding factor-like protein-domain-containing protein n=1 Tax=Pseudomassariella vexata TaxID=1141098 RepID=A0A1Y2DGV8_9PEZI|nr:GC-rich sequence DNA-binding factor-like protein-domain-containing protein [Pseudomassariella vexata]ORY58467.1 GC-rich sequence DNA-binding factor-like protein-domain-containing protein [Pseudomassariella vexata]
MSFNAGNISKADAAAYSSSDSDENDDDDFAIPSVDPRADDFGDFNPRKKRRTGGNAKESAALGIFASDSEDDGPGRRWKGKQNLRSKNMAFVSAGQMKLDENEDDEEDGEDDEYTDTGRPGLGAKLTVTVEKEEDDDDEDEDESMAGVGLGFRQSGQGLGWAPPTETENTTSASTPSKPAFRTTGSFKTKYDGSTPLGKGFVPSSANVPVLKDDLEDDTPVIKPKPSAFGGGGKAKSFAARMMEKMGYVGGKGLGAEGQGRNVIIEPNLRPQGVGLGAVREKSQKERDEEKRQARLRGEEIVDSDEEKKKRKRDRKKQGHVSSAGSGASTPRKPKTRYLTVSDIKKAAPGLHIPDAFAPILDMTGPGKKMLTSGSGLLTPTTGTEVVEQTEARKLAGRAQRDLSAFVEEWKTLEERKAWLGMETHQRQQELDEVQKEFASLQKFASALDVISQAARDKEWDPIIKGLKDVEAAGSSDDDYAAIAVAAIHPFMRDAVQGWLPMEDPKLGNFVSDLTSIRGVLSLDDKVINGNAVAKWDEHDIDGTHRHHKKSTTPYESMIYKLLFPKLITTIATQWDVYDSAPLLAVFDKWDSLLPGFVRTQLLDQVVRRLDDAISAWKPRKKHQQHLPHLWLFPWFQHLPTHHLDPRGTGIVSDVRRKFRALIDAWDFDKGVIPGLKQWKEIFRPSKSQDQWKPLIMHHVLPAMARYLRTNFRVDPGDQEPYLPMLTGVLKWMDVLAPSMVAEVLVAEVFPMWLDVLYQWLTSDEANYEEVGAWFEWWQNEVLGDLKSNESIAAEFEKGMALIEQALDLGPNAKSRLSAPRKQPAHQPKPRSHRDKAQRIEQHMPTAQPPEPVQREKTFRDEIEDWCNENDLRFIPTHKFTDTGEKYVRLTARMDGKGGVMAYFRKSETGEVLVVESRKTNMQLRRDAPVDRELLLEVLLKEVE